jgi:hypothetical protein
MNGGPARSGPALIAVALAFTGCSDAESQQELDLARKSVQAALDAWKRGEAAETLRSLSPPLEFHDDDWGQAARLIDYQIVQVYHETDGSPRCAVALTVQHGGGEPTSLKVTYQVNTRPKVVIARDPFS